MSSRPPLHALPVRNLRRLEGSMEMSMVKKRVWMACCLGMVLASPGELWACDSDGSSTGDLTGDTCPFETTTGKQARSGSQNPLERDEPSRSSLGISISGRSAMTSSMDLGGSSWHDGEKYTYALKGRDIRADERAGFLLLDARYGVHVIDYLYVGVELSLGAGSEVSSSRTRELMVVRPGSLLYLGGGAVVGTSLPLGDFRLRGELLTGFRSVHLEIETQLEDCIETETHSTWAWAVEPRLAMDYWVKPYLTLGAFVGMDVLELGSVYGGVGVALHIVSFDGMDSVF